MIHLSLFPALNYTWDSFCVFTDCQMPLSMKMRLWKYWWEAVCLLLYDSLEEIKWELCRGTEEAGEWCSFTHALTKGLKSQPKHYPRHFVELSEIIQVEMSFILDPGFGCSCFSGPRCLALMSTESSKIHYNWTHFVNGVQLIFKCMFSLYRQMHLTRI